MKMVVMFLIIVLLSGYCNGIKYRTTWHGNTITIDFAEGLYYDEFPFKPTKKEAVRATWHGFGALIDFKVRVVDEEGRPLENAMVTAKLEKKPDAKYDKQYTIIDELTDKDGMVHINGKCDGRALFFVRMDGWYDSVVWEMFFHGMSKASGGYTSRAIYALQDGKWHPYGATHTVVMRPVKNKIPMYCSKNSFIDVSVPKDGTPIGVDLFEFDCVQPYGKGKVADFYMAFKENKDNGGMLPAAILTFPNKGDGACRLPLVKYSTYKTVYTAPTEDSAYRDRIIIEERVNRVDDRGVRMPIDEYFVMRTRTKLDDNGKVVSCHYSKIKLGNFLNFFGSVNSHGKGILSMVSFANPTPNDTNLEGSREYGYQYDPERAEELKRWREEYAKEQQNKSATVDRGKSEIIAEGDMEDANPEEAAAVVAHVNAFLSCLKTGKKDCQTLFYLTTQEQRESFEKKVARGIPFFASGKFDAAADRKAFVKGDSAIVPIRQWQIDTPRVFGIERACLLKRDGKWLLLGEFENYNSKINNLDQDTLGIFKKLDAMYFDYRRQMKKEMAEQ